MQETLPSVFLVKLLLMETSRIDSTAARELPIVGGHLALDFANTVDDPLGPGRHDHASTYDDIVRWSVRVGTLTETQASRLRRTAARHRADAAATVERAHELRATMNEIFGAIADGTSGVRKGWTRLSPRVADAVANATLDDSGPGAYKWSWSQDGDLASVLHPIASAAADLLISNDLSRVKRCARCPWLFLDSSKNHSRRWCDMNDCGQAQKIERYVARRAAARRHAR
jgi:predicted RNA-binding Zn ribbon-like protein